MLLSRTRQSLNLSLNLSIIERIVSLIWFHFSCNAANSSQYSHFVFNSLVPDQSGLLGFEVKDFGVLCFGLLLYRSLLIFYDACLSQISLIPICCIFTVFLPFTLSLSVSRARWLIQLLYFFATAPSPLLCCRASFGIDPKLHLFPCSNNAIL